MRDGSYNDVLYSCSEFRAFWVSLSDNPGVFEAAPMRPLLMRGEKR